MQNQSAWQWLLILVATVPLTGCQYLSAGEDIEIIDPIATTIETRKQAVEADQEAAIALDDEDAFEDPLLDALPTVTADLIQSTDPSARAQAVSRSRVDPFATLPIPLAPEPIELPDEITASANNASESITINPSDFSTPANPTQPAVQVKEEPVVEPPVVVEPSVVEEPSIPQTVVAQTVAVSGVIQLDGTSYAIVQAGDEPERYVKVGDRIGSGSVQVIHIDMLAYEPKVIFEENGIKVTRPVSSGTAETEAPTEETTEPIA